MTNQLSRRRVLAFGAATIPVALAGCSDDGASGQQPTAAGASLEGVAPDLYRSAGCTCCGDYATYLRERGTAVTDHVVEDRAAVRERHGVPAELGSCHTVVLDAYAVEGHVPAGAIDRLRTEAPDVDGIALPGMPTGAPGMPGERSGALEVRTFDDGAAGDVFAAVD